MNGADALGGKALSWRVASTTPRRSPFELLGRRVKDGDERAMDSLLILLTPHVRRVAASILGAHSLDLEDCTQESLIAFAKAFPTFRGDSTVLYFAHQITVRLACNTRRRLSRTHGRAEDISEAVDQVGGDHPPDAVSSAELRDALTQLIEELPEVQARALVLREAMEYSLEEAAVEQGVSIHTLRSRVRQAKRVLRRRAAQDARILELLPPRRDIAGQS